MTLEVPANAELMAVERFIAMPPEAKAVGLSPMARLKPAPGA